ncbi:hypothetical protein GCM10027277_56270 [Pseudoduganella ginsengisoli]|uniref:Outer membrane beta-barrel protein n=1 Tax=Pseudoduganella ginsengisoli TaxID=1462440 RepID=A0A6L6Q2D0_9BURK|nr:hypothetical protein [Pseudoduganella ginsengisoli]MTW03997.1 hypothetical protein [Pseudoduganella ginsengisoli]
MTDARILAVLCAMLLPGAVMAQDDTGGKIDYKLTAAYYAAQDKNDGKDVNLRASLASGNLWIGHYRDKEGFHQTRIGGDTRAEYEMARIGLSLEAASGGYKGVYLGAELGGDTFAIAGLSRSNLRPFYNLSFDPSDTLTLGVGTRAIKNSDVQLFTVWDNRLHTGQRVTHLNWRLKVAEGERLTVNYSYKTGMIDTGRDIHGMGLTVGYDYNNYFFRAGVDQYANFTASRINRFAAGFRF